MDNFRPIPIIYIVGMGHSGSTLLELLISSAPQVWAVGEFAFYPYYKHHIDQSGIGRDFKCACMTVMTECDFWTQINDERDYIIKKRFTLYENALVLLQIFLFGLTGIRAYWKKLQSFVTIRSAQHKSQAYNIREDLPSGMIDDSAEVLQSILRGAQEIKPGATTIVDSSKDPRRLYYYMRSSDFEVYPVFLTRDVRAIAYSNSKKERETVHKMRKKKSLLAALQWLALNSVIELLLFRNKRTVRIAYHRLCADPEGTIEQLNTQLGISIPKDYLDIMNTQTYHTIDGSYMRYEPIPTIAYRASWKKKLPRVTRLFLTCTLWPFNWYWVRRLFASK